MDTAADDAALADHLKPFGLSARVNKAGDDDDAAVNLKWT